MSRRSGSATVLQVTAAAMHPSLLHKPLNVMCMRRFFCSELVAQMLVHAGQVKLKRNLDYLPSNKTHGHVLDAPIIATCPASTYAGAEKVISGPSELSSQVQAQSTLLQANLLHALR
jgi:hypothetical protein